MDVDLNLEGEEGQISAETLYAALGDFLELLDGAAGVADVGGQAWRIRGLESASAHISVTAPEAPAVADVLRSGLNALLRRAAVPDGWSRQMVQRVLTLGKRAGSGGATEVSLGLGANERKHVLTTVIVDHAERALGSATATRGSLRGHVDRWNEHSKREIGLSRPEGGSVSATYKRALSSRIVTEAVGHDIEAWGVIRRNVVGQIAGMTIEDFTILERPAPVSITALAGVLRSSDGLTLEGWIEGRHAD